MEEFFKSVMEAQKEAFKNEIKANTIFINSRFAKTKSFLFGRTTIPEMICGLEVKVTDELPDDFIFSITETTETEREKLIKFTREKTVREIFGELIKSTALCEPQGGHCSLDYLKVKAGQYGAEFTGFDKNGNVIWVGDTVKVED